MTSKVKEIRTVYNGLQTLYSTYLPKVDPNFINDLLTRQQRTNPNIVPFYMVEVFTKPKTDSEAKRNLIFEKTGTLPAIYDNGTHYAANHRLTLEMLQEISNDGDVLEVSGEYTGSVGGWGASHDYRGIMNHNNGNSSSSKQILSSSIPIDQSQQKIEKKQALNKVTTTTTNTATTTTNESATTADKLKVIKSVYRGLHTLFEIYLPKADPGLIHDLLVREQRPNEAPFYMVEIFTKHGTNSEVMKDLIIEKTSMVPAIYDKGTHYVTNQRLTLEMLEEICDYQNIVEIMGEYTGGITGRGASHEHRDMQDYY